MSVVKINAVTIPEGMGEEFIERFAKRAGSVESQPGFEEFLLLRPTDGKSTFFVFTRWESEEAFQGWMDSRDFAAAHANAQDEVAEVREHGRADMGDGDGGGARPGHPGGGAPAGPVGMSAELLAFDVVERVTASE